MVKFTVLGGSSVAVPEMVGAIIPYMDGQRQMQIMLHGRSADKLAVVGQVSQRMASVVPGLSVKTTTDLHEALTGADFVLNQVRVGGLAARAYDETFPHRWNIPGEETVGPGGAANALRTVPVVLDLCREVERYAPDCTLITFSNPNSVVQRAVMQQTRLKAIGLCDAPYTMHRLTAKALNLPMAQVDAQYVGMHHFGWITSALVDDVERLPEALADDAVCKGLGLEPEIGRVTGTVPHMYFRYFFHPDRMLAKQRSASQPRAGELQQIENELLAAYAQYEGHDKPEAVARRSAAWYEVVVVPVLAALAFGVPARLAVNITNDGRVDALPDDTIIEITADIAEGQIRAANPRRLPPPSMMGILQANAAYEQVLVDAIVNDSPELLLQALLMNPLVPSYDVAKEIIAELWQRRGWPESERA